MSSSSVVDPPAAGAASGGGTGAGAGGGGGEEEDGGSCLLCYSPEVNNNNNNNNDINSPLERLEPLDPNFGAKVNANAWAVFVLRKLLRFTSEEVENLLVTRGGAVEPAHWFQICRGCVDWVGEFRAADKQAREGVPEAEARVSLMRRQLKEKLWSGLTRGNRRSQEADDILDFLEREVEEEEEEVVEPEDPDGGDSEAGHSSVSSGSIPNHSASIIEDASSSSSSSAGNGTSDNNNRCSTLELGTRSNTDVTLYVVPNSIAEEIQDVPSAEIAPTGTAARRRTNATNNPCKSGQEAGMMACETSSTKEKEGSIEEGPAKKKKQLKKLSPVVINGEHITILGGDPPMYQCNVCQKMFKTTTLIKYHEFCIVGGGGDKPFKCVQCAQRFIGKGHYEYHLRTHTGKRSFLCPICDKGFNQRAKLTRHIRSHTGEKPFVCQDQECNRGFTTAEALRCHKRNHTGERPFACTFCGKQFTGKIYLKKHVLTHTGERRFGCSHCGKRFGFKCNLDRHLRTHSSERPLACDQCSRAFSSRKYLRQHLVIHSEQRLFQCRLCGTTFKRKVSLDSHIKNTHEQPKEVAKQLANEAAAQYLKNTATNSRESLTDDMPMSKGNAVVNSSMPRAEERVKEKLRAGLTSGDRSQHMGDILDFLERGTYDSKKEVEEEVVQPEDRDGGDSEASHSSVLVTTGSISSHSARIIEGASSSSVGNGASDNNNRTILELGTTSTDVPLQVVPNSIAEEMEDVPSAEIAPTGTAARRRTNVTNNRCKSGKKANPCKSGKEAGMMACETSSSAKEDEGKTEGPAKRKNKKHSPVEINPKCGKGFYQRGKVTRHIRSHTGEKAFICQECNRGFATSQNLGSHMRIHTGGPVACTYCGKRFAGMIYLKKHVITHTGERRFSSNNCDKSHSSRTIEEVSSSARNGASYNNNNRSIFEIRTRSNTDLPLQVGPNSIAEEMQDVSSAEIAATGTADRRRNRNTTNKPCKSGKKANRCKSGKKVNRCKSGKKVNRCTSTKKVNTCKSGKKANPCKSGKKANPCKSGKKAGMMACETTCAKETEGSTEGPAMKKKSSPVVINGDHITILGGDTPMYQCNVCQKKFKTKWRIKYHEFCIVGGGGDKPFKCGQCGKGFIAKGHYEYHLRTHTGARPYVRPKGGKGFNKRGTLREHIRSHTGEKPFVCQECNRGFATAQNLRCHTRIHTGERPFACTYCCKQFTTMTILKNHVITHTGERRFSCNHCGKRFGLKGNLDCHLRTHSVVRPYACDQCGRAFSNRTALRRHLVIHSGQRPFQCLSCGTAFRHKVSLDKHLKNTHQQPKEVSKQLANDAATQHLKKTAKNSRESLANIPVSTVNAVVISSIVDQKADLRRTSVRNKTAPSRKSGQGSASSSSTTPSLHTPRRSLRNLTRRQQDP